MTNYENDIFTRLQAGENIEDIAKELTANLNKANEQYQAAQKEKAEEAAKRAETEKNKAIKVEAIKFLIDALVEVGEAWGLNDTITTIFSDIDAEEIVEDIDKAMPVIKQYLVLQESMQDLLKKTADEDKVDQATIKMSIEDPVEQFLNAFVR